MCREALRHCLVEMWLSLIREHVKIRSVHDFANVQVNKLVVPDTRPEPHKPILKAQKGFIYLWQQERSSIHDTTSCEVTEMKMRFIH